MDLRIISQYCYSLRDGKIRERFYGPYGNDVIADFGLEVPCSADEFHRRWSESSMGCFPEQREAFLRIVSCGSLHAALESGRESVVMDYHIIDRMGIEKLVHTRIEFQREDGAPVAIMCNYSG